MKKFAKKPTAAQAQTQNPATNPTIQTTVGNPATFLAQLAGSNITSQAQAQPIEQQAQTQAKTMAKPSVVQENTKPLEIQESIIPSSTQATPQHLPPPSAERLKLEPVELPQTGPLLPSSTPNISVPYKAQQEDDTKLPTAKVFLFFHIYFLIISSSLQTLHELRLSRFHSFKVQMSNQFSSPFYEMRS